MVKLLTTVLAVFCLWTAGAAELNWQTDLPKALAQAKTENKLVFMDFTGSDWCESCKILDANVLDEPAFAVYAQTNLVLVQLDFPDKKPQSDALKTANLALAKKFNVIGYPTLIVLNPDGKELWRNEGDPLKGPADLIAKINALRKS